jgi:hypothetical protein
VSSPFAWVGERAQPPLILTLTLLSLGLSLWLGVLGQALESPEAPNGIVSFELARHLDRSAAILVSWSASAREAAMLIQGLDYLYLLVYPAWFSACAARLGARLGGAWQRAGALVAWGVLLAAPLDAVENHALIAQLVDGASEANAQLAFWCALPKFALVGLGALFLFIAGGQWLLLRLGTGRTGAA